MDTDKVSTALMMGILRSRGFQRHWIDETAEVLANQETLESKLSNFKLFDRHKGTCESKSVQESEVEMTLRLVVEDCDRATGFFIRGQHLARKYDQGNKFNQDASSLFELTASLDKLRDSDRFQLERWYFLARRLRKLLQSFGTKLISVFEIGAIANNASILCELLYRLEECIVIHRPGTDTTQLQKSADRFSECVVKCLDKMQQNAKPRPRPSHSKKGKYNNIAQKSDEPSYQLAVTIQPSSTPSRPKSFLLPADLELRRSRSQSNLMLARSGEARPRITKAFQRQCYALDSKSRTLTGGQETLARSLDRDDRARTALRMACRVTREVVEQLDRHAQ